MNLVIVRDNDPFYHMMDENFIIPQTICGIEVVEDAPLILILRDKVLDKECCEGCVCEEF